MKDFYRNRGELYIFNQLICSIDIIITGTTEIEEPDVKVEKQKSTSEGRCLTEKGLDLYGGTFIMAPTDTFSKESFGQCLYFCMSQAPDQSHLLISYYNALLIGDKVSGLQPDFPK